MIIWRGWGLLVPVLAFVGVLGVNLAVDKAWGAGYWANHDWPLPAGLAISAALLWLMGRAVNRKPAYTLVDPATGIEMRVRPARHSFFYVPMEWYALPLVAMAALPMIGAGR